MKKLISRRQFLAAAGVAAAAGVLTACGGSSASTAGSAAGSAAAASGDTIKVGVMGPLTGDASVYGQAVVNGASLYIKQVNADGGVNGKQLEVIAMDEQGDETQAVTCFTKMVDQGITALVGDVTTAPTLAVAAESKRAGDMVNSRKLFDDSETAHPIEPEEYIPVENIRGKLLLIGAEDDALWDAAKYIRRMEKRLAEKPHECEIETMVYAHGTHFVFPEGMLKIMLPVGSGLFVKWAFHAARKYPKECRETRKDIEKRMCRVLAEWKGEK